MSPPLVVMKTPPPSVPAYTVLGEAGSTRMALIGPPVGPLPVHVLFPAQTGATASDRDTKATTAIRPRRLMRGGSAALYGI